VRIVAKGTSAGRRVAELLLDQIADHSLGLGTQDVEWVGLDLSVCSRLEGEQAHLGAVAMRENELVPLGNRRQCPRRGLDVGPLDVDGHRFAPLEQGIAAESDEDAHGLTSSAAERGDQ
jgi:hypothetical protein